MILLHLSVKNNCVSERRIVSYSSPNGICLLNDATEQYLDYTASVATGLDVMSDFREREYTAVGYAVLDDGTVVYGRSITDNTRYTALISLRNYQVAVTYTHIDGWNGSLSQPQLDLLAGTKQNLSSSENLRIVFFW